MSHTFDWANLFQEEAPRLRRFLRRFGPRISPEDVAQDAFARLCVADVARIESPRAFLFKTARNLALNEARHNRVVAMDLAPDIDALGAVSPDPSPEERVALAEDVSELRRALSQLMPNQRDALLLFKLEGFSHREIGERLGVSPRTVERYIADAVAHCHLAFKARAREE